LIKRYETTPAIDGVDLQLQEGEVRGLLGPNGAGKTTLLRLLFGLMVPDGGSIELLGRRLQAPDRVELEGVAGFVEDPAFYPYVSGATNLELMAELDDGPAHPPIDEVLERVDLAHRADDRVSGYSTGMRQRLGIAAALMRSPRLLLLDEPTSGLDPAGARAVASLLRELSSQGVAVLLSSHLIGEVESVCDSFTVLRRGRVVWNGTAAELQAEAPGSAYALVTSDDARALEVAGGQPGLSAGRLRNGRIAITVDDEGLDSFVLALAHAEVAVRRLDLLVSPLESMFFALTTDRHLDRADAAARTGREGPGRGMTAAGAPTRIASAPPTSAIGAGSGAWRVYRAERRKLSAQLATRLLALLCVAGPFAFAGILKVQSGTPADTLFGVWVHSSGFAIALVVLGFAGSWGFPLMAGVLAGDMFSAEDRYGTWKTVLTRSRSRRDTFVGKLLAALTFSLALVTLTAISSLVAGLLLVGDQSLVAARLTSTFPSRARSRSRRRRSSMTSAFRPTAATKRNRHRPTSASRRSATPKDRMS
jgi:ABC-2 type transport system ATP-binding protein